MMVCIAPAGDRPVGETLERPYFDLHLADWTGALEDPGGMEFNLPISEWFGLFTATGFEVLDYLEVRAPADATTTEFWVPAAWAQQWPSEQVWRLRRAR